MARYAEKEAPLLERIIMQEGLERSKAEDWARDEIIRLSRENARLRGENWELVMRAHALLSLLPPETTCGQVQEARAKLAAVREGGK